jgi:MFS family permease
MSNNHIPTASWGALMRGQNGLRALALTGGVALHAINVHIVTTVLPSVVHEIGGLDWYAWNTTLFMVTSIIGASFSVRVLAALGPRGAYLSALLAFAVGSAICAMASSMPMMLTGRSVQGLGGGLLAALSYALIRVVFAAPLWPRAIALVSGMWGISTLCGPAVGGLFAQAGHWRWAFWTLLPIALAQSALVAVQLRPQNLVVVPRDTSIPPVPLQQIILLSISVLAIAAGSLSPVLLWQTTGVGVGLLLGAATIFCERRASINMLPKRGTVISTPLGAAYASIALLLIGVMTEIFVPYFLQTLHGHNPLTAGYLTAAMAAGWSLGSLLFSGHGNIGAARLLRAGPALCTVSLLVLAALLPYKLGLSANWHMALTALALTGAGAGVGIGWPHLVTRVLTVAPPGEESTASAAITTVQLYGMAIGAAIAGLVVNAAGITAPGGAAGAQSAAVWLFLSFALAPALAMLLARRLSPRV